MMDPITSWLFRELGRLVKGIGSAFIVYAIWKETGRKPTRQELRQADAQQD